MTAASQPDDYGDPRLCGFSLSAAEVALLGCCPVVLHGPTWGRLYDLGVFGDGITGFSPFEALQAESVCRLPGGRFGLAKDAIDATGAVLAVIIPALDSYRSTADLVAWIVTTDEVLTWLGEASMLGADHLDAERVPIFPSILTWLRADRRGVFVLDPERARWALGGRQIVAVGDAAFARRLRAALVVPSPKILIEEESVDD